MYTADKTTLVLQSGRCTYVKIFIFKSNNFSIMANEIDVEQTLGVYENWIRYISITAESSALKI